jgi:hypothetical protein
VRPIAQLVLPIRATFLNVFRHLGHHHLAAHSRTGAHVQHQVSELVLTYIHLHADASGHALGSHIWQKQPVLLAMSRLDSLAVPSTDSRQTV